MRRWSVQALPSGVAHPVQALRAAVGGNCRSADGPIHSTPHPSHFLAHALTPLCHNLFRPIDITHFFLPSFLCIRSSWSFLPPLMGWDAFIGVPPVALYPVCPHFFRLPDTIVHVLPFCFCTHLLSSLPTRRRQLDVALD